MIVISYCQSDEGSVRQDVVVTRAIRADRNTRAGGNRSGKENAHDDVSREKTKPAGRSSKENCIASIFCIKGVQIIARHPIHVLEAAGNSGIASKHLSIQRPPIQHDGPSTSPSYEDLSFGSVIGVIDGIAYGHDFLIQ